MVKTSLVTGAIIGSFGVILGAVAAHVLRPVMPEESMISFRTATTYQMYHALLMLMLPLIFQHIRKSWHRVIYWMLLLGILLFSGSIYFLSLGPMFNLTFQWMGPITPIGGMLLILTWISIGIAALLKKE